MFTPVSHAQEPSRPQRLPGCALGVSLHVIREHRRDSLRSGRSEPHPARPSEPHLLFVLEKHDLVGSSLPTTLLLIFLMNHKQALARTATRHGGS